MPSPGSNAILARMLVRSRARALEGRDLRLFRHEIAELVDTLQHAVPREWIDGEPEAFATRQRERRAREIDREYRTAIRRDERTNALDHGLGQRDGQKTVAERVVAK